MENNRGTAEISGFSGIVANDTSAATSNGAFAAQLGDNHTGTSEEVKHTEGTPSEISDFKMANQSNMQQESAKLYEMQEEMMDTSESGAEGDETNKHLSIQERQEIDARSVYVGNIDYSATPEQVQQAFSVCGTINRVTILTNKHTGVPLGYGFVEFDSHESVAKALELDQTILAGREIKVTEKRTNVPGFSSRGRGRGRGGFRGRGGMRGRGNFRGRNVRGGLRGGRGGFRGRGRGGFSPY